MSRTDEKGYNGWTNYATWRVMLEIFDGYDPSDDFAHSLADDVQELTRDLAYTLQEMAEGLIYDTSREGLAQDYALAFINDVNWYEIAESFVADYDDRIPERIRTPEAEDAN